MTKLEARLAGAAARLLGWITLTWFGFFALSMLRLLYVAATGEFVAQALEMDKAELANLVATWVPSWLLFVLSACASATGLFWPTRRGIVAEQVGK